MREQPLNRILEAGAVDGIGIQVTHDQKIIATGAAAKAATFAPVIPDVAVLARGQVVAPETDFIVIPLPVAIFGASKAGGVGWLMSRCSVRLPMRTGTSR